MLDVTGLTLTEQEREVISHPNTGGVILFTRNYHDPQQLTDLIQSIRAVKDNILIAVDQEGGRVQRFQHGFTRLPPASHYAYAPDIAQSAGWLMASELLAVGVDFSFAPVLDVDCGISQVIGNRSFSHDETVVSQLASAFRKGMQSAGMSAVGKHFPGHGAVALDSHLTLPVDDRPFDDIYAKDLVPFRELINQGLEAVMPAHVVYSQVDNLPAGFSSHWLQTVLRGQLNFNGAIFSDDLTMAGAEVIGDFTQRALAAQQAGCDMILVCNNPTAAVQVIETLPIEYQPLREQRLQAMRGRPHKNREQLMQCEKWQYTTTLINP